MPVSAALETWRSNVTALSMSVAFMASGPLRLGHQWVGTAGAGLGSLDTGVLVAARHSILLPVRSGTGQLSCRASLYYCSNENI
jgi:hypothetical protein